MYCNYYYIEGILESELSKPEMLLWLKVLSRTYNLEFRVIIVDYLLWRNQYKYLLMS